MALLHRATLRPSKLELLAAWLPGRTWFQGIPDADVERMATYRFDDPDGAVGIETFLVRVGGGPVLQVPLTYRGAPLAGAEAWLVGTTEHSALGRRWVYDGCGDPVYAAALASAILDGTGQAAEYFEVDGVREYRAPSMTIDTVATTDADADTDAETDASVAGADAGMDTATDAERVGTGTQLTSAAGIGRLRRVDDGDPTLVVTDRFELAVVRVLGPGGAAAGNQAPVTVPPAAPVAAWSAGPFQHALTGAWDGQPDPLPLAYAVPVSRDRG